MLYQKEEMKSFHKASDILVTRMAFWLLIPIGGYSKDLLENILGSWRQKLVLPKGLLYKEDYRQERKRYKLPIIDVKERSFVF